MYSFSSPEWSREKWKMAIIKQNLCRSSLQCQMLIGDTAVPLCPVTFSSHWISSKSVSVSLSLSQNKWKSYSALSGSWGSLSSPTSSQIDQLYQHLPPQGFCVEVLVTLFKYLLFVYTGFGFSWFIQIYTKSKLIGTQRSRSDAGYG